MPATRHAHEDYPIRQMMTAPILGRFHQPVTRTLLMRIPGFASDLTEKEFKPEIVNHLTKFDLMSGI